MDTLSNQSMCGNISFIFSLTDEVRSLTAFTRLCNSCNFENLLIIKYNDVNIPKEITDCISENKITCMNVSDSPVSFLKGLKEIPIDFWNNKVVIDISCIRIPEMFTLLKFLKLRNVISEIDVIYSLPYDYLFLKEPFTSYKSYIEDLTMYELLGFSGAAHDTDPDLFLFMGFEGSLALKVVESSSYRSLKLINNLPPFYPKYKDISVINNYQLMQNSFDAHFTPADNPFEVYNLLDDIVDKK